MPISKIKSSAIDANAITGAGIADGTVTSADLDTNIDIAGTLDVTGTLTADAAGSIAGNLGVGTTSPGQKLEVNSGNSTVGMRIRRFSGSYYSDIVHTDSPEGLAFKVGDGSSVTERLRILGTGGITFNGDTAAANALDDYEEGNWEPTLEGVSSNPTVSYQADTGGYYIKIGRMVYLTGTVRTTSVSGGSGTVMVGGLPFSIASRTNGDNADGVGAVRCVIWDGTSTTVPTIVQMKHGNANLNIMSSRHDGTTTTLQVSNWGNSCMIAFNITIYTN
jgi:hypothetical protein